MINLAGVRFDKPLAASPILFGQKASEEFYRKYSITIESQKFSANSYKLGQHARAGGENTSNMAPKKKSPLEKMREKTKIKNREARAMLPGSAFDLITDANAALNPRPAYTSDTEGTSSKPSAASAATPKKITKAKKATPTKKVVEKREKPRDIESWQPAGGEQKAIDGAEATSVLGIARISAWRLDSFRDELEDLLDIVEGNDLKDIFQYVIVMGGERIADVYVRFGSKLNAAIMRQSIDGKMIGGRRLRIYYAAE
ncbi:hypothetical protein AC579_8585 [Pseudocercospora musae]|uniref:Uncharacterized protein n=1 Tax=Pseudocercospora musae TaxID=113226 RepID=A0A139IB04_9PEZI|nr:hypothetical protein AC579_8585 [Pseudocercospora musae]